MTRKLIFLFVSIAILNGCSSKEDVKMAATEAVTVKTIKLEKKIVSTTLTYTATLEADEQVYYAPASPGRIGKIYVEVGDRIKKGQLLVQMDPTSFNQAKIQLKNLETEYNRAVKLNETGSISKQAYDAAVTSYEVAKSNVEFLEENTKMLAPFDGIVTGKYFENGELYTGVAAGGAAKPSVILIEKIKPVKAYVNLAEHYYLALKEGMKIQLKSEIYPDKIFDGKVSIVYPTIDKSSRTFKVEIIIPNEEELLRPGMYGTINFFVGEIDALIAPSLAILKLQGANNRYAFINNNGVAKRVDVTIGRRFDDRLEIFGAGIKAGDELVVVGQGKLIDGTKLKVVE
ncbi:MAG: efflux RND transporter periplasmic adaptor subunit [Culturomica sp.]|jgi:RND family efflux transporter MFP subunit|nr:efflux RND transporter periplasmic adaptor subunit [Culturomica sp.]